MHGKHKQLPKDEEKQPAPAEETMAQEPAGEAAGQEEVAPSPSEDDPCQKELAMLKDRYARLLADFDNFRRRQLRDREETVKRANEALLEDLLPALDTFDLALANATNPDDPFVKGIQLTFDQLAGALEKNGMVPVDAEGEFDPNQHEALTQSPSAEVPAGEIMALVRRGWLLNDRLLRAAQVIVSSGAPEAEA